MESIQRDRREWDPAAGLTAVPSRASQAQTWTVDS